MSRSEPPPANTPPANTPPANTPAEHIDAHGILWLAECGSTNDEAWRRLEDPTRSPPRAVVAHRQTAGRGRRGRSWFAPEGCTLALSLGIRPAMPPDQGAALPLLAAVAVADVCQARGLTPWLKWPNDVRVGAHKLAGILCEARSRGTDWWAVVGIGLNLRTPPAGWPADVPGIALDATEADGPFDAAAVAPALVAAFEARLAFAAAEGFAAVLSAFAALAPPPGTRFTQAGRSGIYAGLGDDGALLLRDDQGQVHAIRTGEVALVGDAPA